MTKKQWQNVAWVNYICFFGVFLICLNNQWEKIAWFVVFPAAMAASIFIRYKKRNSN
jgi:hypothetical protein